MGYITRVIIWRTIIAITIMLKKKIGLLRFIKNIIISIVQANKLKKNKLVVELSIPLGTKNNKTLKQNSDGSLTLYVQSDSPGADKESNWLPAPENADFSLYIRTYWPKQEVLDGSWKPPVVQEVK